MTMADTLAYLIGGYLHQDFDAEFGTMEGAVAAMLDQEQDEDIAALVRDTRLVLEAHHTETSMERYFKEIRAGVYPPGKGDGTTHVSFVQYILAEAEAELARRRS